MLRITAIGAGAVDYLLKGSGCEREHQTPTVEQQQDAPGYYLEATAHGEAPGVWHGQALEMLGIEPGQVATEDDVTAVFGELKHPDTGEQLGRAPRTFKSYEQRLEAALAQEPDATPERRRELEIAAKTDGRKATAYYDLTFSPVKSVSVYYAALLQAGATDEAEQVLQAHRDAIDTAMNYAEQHAAYTRTGYHGKTANGRSVGRYEQATGLIQTRWEHSTNRENEPQLHTHVAVLNRVQTSSDGQVRALDGKGFRPIKEAVATGYEMTLERNLEERLGLTFALRPDGKNREILGVDPDLCAAASTRRTQVEQRTEELVSEYIERHGHEPSPQARKAIAQNATYQTRKAKDHEAGTPSDRFATWSQGKHERLDQSLDEVRSKQSDIERDGHPDFARLPNPNDRQAVLKAAVESVQQQYSTWTVGNLTSAIREQIVSDSTTQRPSFQEAQQMAQEVLQAGNNYGVLMVTAPDMVQTPTALQRNDGRSVYRAHIDERYATREHLGVEERIVTGARQDSAPRLIGDDIETLRMELVANGLSDDQLEAVSGIVSSGRAGDVLIGPAGAGKSRTVGALSQVWEDQFGGRVLGLATSQRATQVLAEDGLNALNTSQFLQRFTPDHLGQSHDAVRPGDLIVVDESGMANTDELDRISQLVESGGGKLLYTGDHAQLDAVGAGGMLKLLADDNGAHELQEIHRFHESWEREASTRLRVGDVDVVREYEDHGRLRGGSLEEMQDAAIRGYLADTLEDKESLLVVGNNAAAADLSARIHAELVRLGHVDNVVLGQLRDGNVIGAGDVIQARRNDSRLAVDGPGMVTNREIYTVRGWTDSGRLQVARDNGALAYLTEDYLRQHATLAYASTVHAAQGRTVDTTHSLIEHTTGRDAAYVMLTRGRQANYGYTITEREPNEHDPERLASSSHGVLTTVLENDDRQQTAVAELRTGLAESESLAVLGTQWDLVTSEYARDRYTDTLATLLGREQMDAVLDEYGYQRLMRTVREAEMAGHEAEAVLTEAVQERELATAESVTDVVRHRIRTGLDSRVAEQHVDPTNWTTLSAPIDGTIGQYAHELAVAASDRQAELGRQAAEHQPTWAVEHLGAPPAEPAQRAEWERRAGIAAAYRELRTIPEEYLSLGASPSREQEFHRTLWQQAYAALGKPTDALDFHAASDTELREMRAAWQREQTWAPHHVAPELQQAYTVAESYRRDAALHTAELDTLPSDSPVRADAVEQINRAERLAAEYAERARQLESIHLERAAWHEATEDTRLQAELATTELEQRGARLTPEPTPEPEQLGLFEIATEYETGPDQQLDASPQVEAHAEPEAVTAGGSQPEVEEDPAERVGWWQRWAAKFGLAPEHEQQLETETPESQQQTTPDTERDPEPVLASSTAGTEEIRHHTAEPVLDTEPQDTVELDEDQLALFDSAPTVADRVQTQPLREQTFEPEEELQTTLAEARRQARAAEHQRLMRHASERERAAQQARDNAAEIAEVDRQRRDSAEVVAEQAPREPEPQQHQIQPTREPEPELEIAPPDFGPEQS